MDDGYAPLNMIQWWRHKLQKKVRGQAVNHLKQGEYLASLLEVIALSFGPVGTDGTRFSVPINRVETVTPVGVTEQAIIRLRMPEDVDIEVQSAMGFHVPVSSTPSLKFMALLITTGNNEYLFPNCRIDHDNLAPVIVRFTVLIDTSLNDDNGNTGCYVIVNGSWRPVDEDISFV